MNLKQKSIWYVYELIDPVNGATFYVGKGKGARVDQHEKDAAKSTEVCSKKIRKIKDIWACGLKVSKRFNAFFWDEQAAYDHETDLIDEYGLENLTNILPGGQKAWIERKAQRQSRKAKQFDIHTLLNAKDEKLFLMFRNWFVLGMDAGNKEMRISANGAKEAHVYAQVTEVAYNKLLPMLLGYIKKSESAILKFAERMKPYNVSIVYGSA